jgi:hypothetical protein
VFKIQANMDPNHRDRMAFLRICSGRFERGMKATHCRLGREVGLGNATVFLARDREIVETAYAGDIIGLPNHGTIKIGDTFTTGEPLRFTGIPSFAPELFRRVLLKSPLKAKSLAKGLTQLAEEGAIQVFKPFLGTQFIVGAVGQLQLEVMKYRLKSEYDVDADYEGIEYTRPAGSPRRPRASRRSTSRSSWKASSTRTRATSPSTATATSPTWPRTAGTSPRSRSGSPTSASPRPANTPERPARRSTPGDPRYRRVVGAGPCQVGASPSRVPSAACSAGTLGKRATGVFSRARRMTLSHSRGSRGGAAAAG